MSKKKEDRRQLGPGQWWNSKARNLLRGCSPIRFCQLSDRGALQQSGVLSIACRGSVSGTRSAKNDTRSPNSIVTPGREYSTAQGLTTSTIWRHEMKEMEYL